MSVVLVGGSVRSGKSAFALRFARGRGPRRLFIATGEPGDADMRARISQHREERGSDFETIEEPLDLAGAFGRAGAADAVVVDCLTLWISNLLLRDHTESAILVRVDEFLTVAVEHIGPVVVVTNEVGLGVIPETPIGRAFRDITGRAHQRAAKRAAEIYMAVLGVILRLVPGPIEVVDRPAPDIGGKA